MTSNITDGQRDALYSKFSGYRQARNPDDQKYAYPVAKEYLFHYGGIDDAETREVREFVTEYERALHQREVFDVFSQKKFAKAFEIGRPLLKTDADHFYVLGVLTEAAYESLLAGNASFTVEAADYARRAIRLLEDGKIKDPQPFKNLEHANAFLNLALGTYVRDQQPVEAAVAFRKALLPDTPFRKDPIIYHRMGAAILKGEFAQVSKEYNEKFGNKPASPEQTKMLQQLQGLVERATDAYARAVALCSKPEQQAMREKILAQLTPLYRSLHDSDAGLNEMIATVLSKPLP